MKVDNEDCINMTMEWLSLIHFIIINEELIGIIIYKYLNI